MNEVEETKLLLIYNTVVILLIAAIIVIVTITTHTAWGFWSLLMLFALMSRGTIDDDEDEE